MIWLAACVVLVLLVVSAGFRKITAIVAVIVGAAAVIAAVGWAIVLFSQSQSRSTARALIPAQEVKLSDVQLEFPDGGPEYGHIYYRLSGRVKNNSPTYTLTNLTVSVVMRDCADAAHTRCETIGEEPVSLYFNNIPPGQVRDISRAWLLDTPARPKGELVWNYSITETVGK
jgi:hypothetical protein